MRSIKMFGIWEVDGCELPGFRCGVDKNPNVDLLVLRPKSVGGTLQVWIQFPFLRRGMVE